jgi:hypothetical protein
VLVLDHALERLEAVDRGLAQIVELRASGGLTIEEAAHVLKVSASTAKREWCTAKAWLTGESSLPSSLSAISRIINDRNRTHSSIGHRLCCSTWFSLAGRAVSHGRTIDAGAQGASTVEEEAACST